MSGEVREMREMGKLGRWGRWRINMKIKGQGFDCQAVKNDDRKNNNFLVLKSKKLVNLVLCFRFSLAFFLLVSCYLYG